MSVIVQDLEDKKIVLLTKGADSVIEELLDKQKVENLQML
jgi:magnesium-transporting ATPase (P-type)